MRRPRIDVPRGIGAAVIAVFLLLGSACTDDDLGLEAAERRVQTAEEAAAEAAATLEQAGLAFCVEAKDYVVAIDRYGKVFGDAAATVGDVRTLGADLVEPKDSTVAATHRDLARSFAVVTASTAHGDPAHDLGAIAVAVDTVVLLMAAGRLGETCAALIAAGRPAAEPAALIQWATTPDERSVFATLADLPTRAAAEHVGPPATLVVGPVVRLSRRQSLQELPQVGHSLA